MFIQSTSSYILSSFNLIVQGPEKAFAYWLANSPFNQQVKTQFSTDRKIDLLAMIKRMTEGTFQLDVKKGKMGSEKFKENHEMAKPTHYSIDGGLIISEERTEKQNSGGFDASHETISLINPGWAPNSKIEHAICEDVNQWMGRQFTLIAFVTLLSEIGAIALTFTSNSDLAMPIGLFATALQIGSLFGVYRIAQLSEIAYRSIPTLGHWAAEIRRYAYTFGSSYAQLPNVKKYLTLNEFNYLSNNYQSFPNGHKLGGKDIKDIKEHRVKINSNQK